MADPLKCPKCETKLSTQHNLAKHLATQPKYCMLAEERRRRSQPEQHQIVNPGVAPVEGDLADRLADLRATVHLPDHVPKSTRALVAEALRKTIDHLAATNSVEAWTAYLVFCFSYLGQPKSEPEHRSLMSFPNQIRRNIAEKRLPETNRGEVREEPASQPEHDPAEESARLMAKRVNRKLQDGDIHGAVRVLVSEETVLPPSPDTFATLSEKHPPNAPITRQPPSPASQNTPPVTLGEVREAIKAFPNGSAGGPDGMRPQYLKELLMIRNSELSTKLCHSIAAMANIMLRGEVPNEIVPILYGANLFAFRKKDNGSRPIAVGLTPRRIVSRIVSARSSHLNSELCPLQLGYATKGGVEAAVHGARYFVEDAEKWATPQVFLKLDVKNAFNTLDRNRVLEAVEQHMPVYHRYVWQCYCNPTILLHGKYRIASRSGIQQGDPLGPLLYCLATAGPHRNLKSKLVESFLDDDVLGGEPEDVFDDLLTLKEALEDRGLSLNIGKCELVVLGGSEPDRENVFKGFLTPFPMLLCPQLEHLSYLGAPLHDSAVPGALTAATEEVRRMTNRLVLLPAHQALFLLQCSLGPVRVIYKLRTGRCYLQKEILLDFDNMIRSSLSAITNTHVTDTTWLQASLPVASGGLGIRSLEKLALPAFLASAYSVANLTSEIIDFDVEKYCGLGVNEWRNLTLSDIPAAEAIGVQNAWDLPMIQKAVAELLETHKSDISGQARLLAVSKKESGPWLRALPVASLGNLLNDTALRTAVALRLGAPVCIPHSCVCGQRADARGYHALSCRRSAGRKQAHATLNAVVKKTFSSAGYETELEPPGISRNDGKRPDGVTLAPWERGKMLTWDATRRCTVALTYLAATSKKAGAAAEQAEQAKVRKYQCIMGDYLFCPLAFETLGPWGPEAHRLLSMLAKKIRQETGDKRSKEFIYQRISIEMQRANAMAILGTTPPSANLDEIFSVIRPRRGVFVN